jgi:Putative beta-barrel porin-2, OmpL-like. bbp2
MFRARPVHSVVSLAALALALGTPAVVHAQPRPPAAPPPDAEAMKKLEQRINDLEAKLAEQAKKAEEEKTAEAKRRADDKAGEARAAESAQITAAVAAHQRWIAEQQAAADKQKEADKKAADALAQAPTPYTYGDFSWAPGAYAPSESPLKWGPFTGELRVDTVYHQDFSNPKDNTVSGSSEVFRSGEFQVTQMGIGGDFYYKGVQARLMTQFGMYSETTPRNDASPGRGQWNLADAYRYISEAYGGYHIDAMNGINIQAGIFMSYVGLWSYYNFDNWTYQPSYVSSNTPWFFDGLRVQIFPSKYLKIEPWLVNGWQSYGKFNNAPGVGLQVLWRPNEAFSILGNQYIGTDALNTPGRKRIHTDDSAMVKLYDDKEGMFSKFALSLTVDAGCEFGDGDKALGTLPVSCGGGTKKAPDQFFLGFMAYARAWWMKNQLATTVGGGAIDNPGRYLVLLPPINGATAFSGTPYFTENPGQKYEAWDMQITQDFIPKEFVIFRAEFNHRAANVPYFTGHGGVTPPGGNQGDPGSTVKGWTPDLVKSEDRITFAMMVRM